MHIISVCSYLAVMVYFELFHVGLCDFFTCNNPLHDGYGTVLNVWLVPIDFYVQFLQKVA